MAGRRLRATLLALTLTLGLMAAPTVAAAAPTYHLAAAEGGEGEEPPGEVTELPGPEPDFQNTFAPEEFETPWHWWLGVVLTAVTVLAIGGIGLGYWLLVRRDES